MKSQTTSLLDFIEESKQLEIPIYQRAYSWESENCEQLWDDIIKVGEKPAEQFEPEHFTGAVIYIEKRNGQARFVIDGQQRLTTVALILEALARHIEKHGRGAEVIRRRYLYDPNEAGEVAHKLLLSETDKETIMALVTQQNAPENYSIRIHDNFNLFREKIRKALKEERAALWEGLKRLTIIAIALDQSQVSPQLVFQSMNDDGVELSNADLIRNYVLMKLSVKEQTALYETHWEPIEAEFGQTKKGYDQGAYSSHFDDFIFYYLGMKIGKLPVKKRLYGEFKAYAVDQKEKSVDARTLVADIRQYAGYYAAIKIGQEKNDRLNDAFNDLQLLRANTPIPFLTALYDLYSERGAALRALAGFLPNLPTEKLERAIRELRDTGDISIFSKVIGGNSNSIGGMQAFAEHAQNHLLGADQFERVVRIIESCVVRRSVCVMPSQVMSALFTKNADDVHKANRKIDALACVQKMPKDLKCPSDSDFALAIKENILRGKRYCAYILRRMENYGRDEPLDLNDYKVKQILSAVEIHEELAGTLGNLTLTTESGNSPLWLNEIPDDAHRWDADAIRKRGEILAERALKVWPTP